MSDPTMQHCATCGVIHGSALCPVRWTSLAGPPDQEWGPEFKAKLVIDAPTDPIPDCPACGRPRLRRDQIRFVWNDTNEAVWDGCAACLRERLDLCPERLLRAVAAMVATRRYMALTVSLGHGPGTFYPEETDETYIARLIEVGRKAMEEKG